RGGGGARGRTPNGPKRPEGIRTGLRPSKLDGGKQPGSEAAEHFSIPRAGRPAAARPPLGSSLHKSAPLLPSQAPFSTGNRLPPPSWDGVAAARRHGMLLAPREQQRRGGRRSGRGGGGESVGPEWRGRLRQGLQARSAQPGREAGGRPRPGGGGRRCGGDADGRRDAAGLSALRVPLLS